jgi:hypothetical protein
MQRSISYCSSIPHDLEDLHFADLYPNLIVPSHFERLLIGPLDLLSPSETHPLLEKLHSEVVNNVIFIIFNVKSLVPVLLKYFPDAKCLPAAPSSLQEETVLPFPKKFSFSQSLAKPECLKLLNPRLCTQNFQEIDALQDVVKSFACPELLAAKKRLGISPTGGILISGPPGIGKTFISHRLAHYAHSKWNIPTWQLNNALLFSAYLGESEEGLREAFTFCRGFPKCILFLDGILDVICSPSARSSGVEKRLLTTLLNELDGIEGAEWRNNVLLIATTRNSQALNEALMRAGRFDFHFNLEPTEFSPSNTLKAQREATIQSLFPL